MLKNNNKTVSQYNMNRYLQICGKSLIELRINVDWTSQMNIEKEYFPKSRLVP